MACPLDLRGSSVAEIGAASAFCGMLRLAFGKGTANQRAACRAAHIGAWAKGLAHEHAVVPLVSGDPRIEAERPGRTERAVAAGLILDPVIERVMPWQCGGRADGSRACAGLGADGMLAEHPAELVFTADETTQELAVSSRRGDHSATRFGREITDAERLAGIAQARCIGKLAVEVIVERFGIGAAQAEIDQQLLIMTAVVAETADVPGREGRVATARKAALQSCNKSSTKRA